MFRVGLTGGIASGKSSVARLFSGHGVPVIDTDDVARAVVEPGTAGLAAVVEAFGDSMLNRDGTLDRRRLRRHVFESDARRQRLEAILHPAIRAETLAQSETAGGPYQLIVVPLLVETDFVRLVDRILVVDCSEATQRARLMARDGIDASEADRMIAAQAARSARLAIADDVVDNDGAPEALAPQVARLHRTYLDMAARRS